MKSLYISLNNFDPFGWLEKTIPPRILHLLIKISAAAVALAFLFLRLTQYNDFAFKPLWLAETLLFFFLAIAFGFRKDPIDRSRGFVEIVIPLIGSVLPFALLFTKPSPWLLGNEAMLTAVFGWMTIATAFTAWGMWTLRHSFSITVEARELVTTGPYRFFRHPIYLGEICVAAAVVVWRWSIVNVIIFFLFVCMQIVRARREEKKLRRVFPEYGRFSARSCGINKEIASDINLCSAVVLFILLATSCSSWERTAPAPIKNEDANTPVISASKEPAQKKPRDTKTSASARKDGRIGDWHITYELSGGYAGIRRRLELSRSGILVAQDLKQQKRVEQRIPEQELDKIAKILAENDFMQGTGARDKLSNRCADCLQQVITLATEGEQYRIDNNMIPHSSASKKLAEILSSMMDQALSSRGEP